MKVALKWYFVRCQSGREDSIRKQLEKNETKEELAQESNLNFRFRPASFQGAFAVRNSGGLVMDRNSRCQDTALLV